MPCKAAYLSKITAGFPLTLVMEDNCCWCVCVFVSVLPCSAILLSRATVWTGAQKQCVCMDMCVPEWENNSDCTAHFPGHASTHLHGWSKLPTKWLHSMQSSRYLICCCVNPMKIPPSVLSIKANMRAGPVRSWHDQPFCLTYPHSPVWWTQVPLHPHHPSCSKYVRWIWILTKRYLTLLIM